MSLQDFLRYGQAHACSCDLVPHILAAVKFIKNEAEFRLANSRPLIGHAEQDKFVLLFRADRNGGALRNMDLTSLPLLQSQPKSREAGLSECSPCRRQNTVHCLNPQTTPDFFFHALQYSWLRVGCK